MLGLLLIFGIGIFAGITLMCIYEVNILNKYENIIDDMAEQLVGLSIWGENKENVIIFNNKEKVKEFFINKEENK